MKKIILIGILTISLSSFAGIFGGGSKGGLGKILKILQNMEKTQANIYTEEIQQTLEAIEQTENQIIQLQNDALNLSKWSTDILENPLNISKDTLDNIQKIRDNANTILSNTKNFEDNFKKIFTESYENWTIEDIIANKDKIMNESQGILDQAMALTTNDQNILDRANALQDLARLTLEPQGALESAQTSNQIEIATATSLSNIEQLESERLKIETLKLQRELQAERRGKELTNKMAEPYNAPTKELAW